MSFALSWLGLAEVSPGKGFLVAEVLAIQVLISEIELLLDSFWGDRQLIFNTMV